MKKFFFVCTLLTLIYLFREETYQTHEFSGVAMTVPYRILVGHVLNSDQILSVDSQISSIFTHTFEVYNKWNLDSELSKVNFSKGNIQISAPLFSLLEKTGHMWKKTEGRFDPTIESTQIGWSHIHLDAGTITKPLEVKLDLGGIAKGQTIDEITVGLQNLGYKNLLVEWGGDFRATGEHPSGRAWRLSIRNPNGGSYKEVELIDQALATSGDYEQFVITDDGKHLSHLIDPTTGNHLERKSRSVTSVSVFAKTCVEADAIATALMLFNQEELTAWTTEHPEYSCQVYYCD